MSSRIEQNINLLNKETSPYLLQHSDNPVHWRAWNTDALLLAKQKNKLELTWIGKDKRPKLEPHILLEDPEFRIPGQYRMPTRA